MELLFERFQPLRKLGQGGFAEVWLAQDSARPDPVACKLLTQSDPGARLRFHREFIILHKLEHRGIIQVYDYLQNGRTLYSMEFVQGTTIRDFLHQYHWREAGPLEKPYYRDPEGLVAALNVLLQITDTLAYLHNQAIVHRDLKPENILYSFTLDHIKLLDFGLVRAQAFDELTTQSGLVQGTPGYISPEQIQGREVDLRADLYSLGVIIYELMTGQLPFQAPALMQLLDMHLKHAPPSARNENPLVPVGLENTIFKLLAKEPARRFSAAAEVGQELRTAREQVMRGETGERSTMEISTMAFRLEAPENLLIAPWIGKEALLQSLRAGLQELAGGKGGFHLVAGGHGTGKSRLLEEVRAEAVNRRAEVLGGAAKERGTLPYGLFQSALAQIHRKHPQTVGAEAGILSKNLPLLEDLGAAGLESMTLTNLDPKGEKARFFHAVHLVFKRLASERPVALLLDDLQWADDSSLELLNHLIYSFTGPEAAAPILFAAALVPEEAQEGTPAAVWLKQKVAREAVRHEMDAMTREELALYVQALLGHPEPPPSRFIGALQDLTGGNPYFILETLRAMIDDNLLKRKTGNLSWDFSMYLSTDRATMTLQKLPMPKNLQDNLDYRLRGYSEEEVLALQSAALIGRRFPFLIWQKVVDLSEDALLDLAERYLAAKILKELPGEMLEFASDQVRAILAEGLTGLRKRRLHGKIADALLKTYDPIPDEQFIPLASNLEACGRKEEALPFYVKAAERASRSYHLQMAESLWKSVAALAGDLPGKEDLMARAAGELGDVAVYSSRYDEAEEHFEKAIDLLSPDQEAFYHWSIRLANCRGQRGKIQEMHAGLYTLLPAIAGKKFQSSEAWCHAYLGVCLWEKGEPEASLVELNKALEMFKARSDTQGLLLVHDNLGIPHFYLGQDAEAEAGMAQALELARRYRDVRRQLVSLSNLLAFYNNHGQLEKARAMADESLPLAESVGDWRLYCFNLYSISIMHQLLGDLPKAASYAQKARDLAQEIGAEAILAHCLILLGEAAAGQESLEEAHEHFAAARETYARLGVVRQLPYADLLLAWVRAVKDKDPGAVEAMRARATELLEAGNTSDHAHGMVYLAEALRRLARPEEARQAAGAALDAAQRHGYGHIAARAERVIHTLES